MDYKFSELIEVMSQDALLAYLDWGTSKMWEQIRLKNDPFAWINGVHYFQPVENGKISFNRRMVEIWLVAKSQKDSQLHLNAIAHFQTSIPGCTPPSKRKNIA